MSDTKYCIIEGEFLGTISTVKSSTNLALGHQDNIRSSTMIANNKGPSFVPWEIPPFRQRGVEMEVSIDTNWVRPSRKTAIHRTRHGWRLKEATFDIRILWSIISKAFLKSAKKKRIQQLHYYALLNLNLREPWGIAHFPQPRPPYGIRYHSQLGMLTSLSSHLRRNLRPIYLPEFLPSNSCYSFVHICICVRRRRTFPNFVGLL